MGAYTGELKTNKLTVRCSDKVNEYIHSFPGESTSQKFGNMMELFLGKEDLRAEAFRQQKIIEELTIEKQELLKEIVSLQGTREMLESIMTSLKSMEHDYVGELVGRRRERIQKEIKESGFIPTKHLIQNLDKLNALTARNNSIQDIFLAVKNNVYFSDPEQENLVWNIAQELKEQELERLPE